MVEIAAMEAADWERVAAIYAEGIATGVATFETETPTWDEWDAAHLLIGRLVARADGGIVGWAALAPRLSTTSGAVASGGRDPRVGRADVGGPPVRRRVTTRFSVRQARTQPRRSRR